MDRDENYRKAFDHALSMGTQPALILVDFVQAYFEPECELYADVDDALASAERILSRARAAAIPVIFTNVVYQAGGVDGGVFYQKIKPLRHFLKGSSMGNFAGNLQPRENEIVISKQYPSAFFGTSLSATLQSLGCDSLIMTGLTTSGCVRATCVDCISHGFIPIVVADACGDRHSAPHDANLFDMQAKYAEVVDEAFVLNYLDRLSVD